MILEKPLFSEFLILEFHVGTYNFYTKKYTHVRKGSIEEHIIQSL